MNWTLAAGDVLAHYRVLSPLGSGGMAQVYLAEDIRLGRQLALKVLSHRAIARRRAPARFEREARAISALNHPNILTIYDVGSADGMQFIATEYIDGVTLRQMLDGGRLAIDRALDIAIQIGQAVAAAHDAGVIHRDLKPENVMVRADGYVKVLDFGLAKLMGVPLGGVEDDPTQLVETRDGIVMGTFNYMAPEQARGGDLDARADLFALGVLLYEMLAGQPPFKGATAADVIGALLFREPQPARPDVPDGLRADRRHGAAQGSPRALPDVRRPAAGSARAVARLGRRSRARVAPDARSPDGERYLAPRARADAGRSIADSAATAGARRTAGTIESLAVLPLVNQSQDEELDYFSDGLTESLINNLSQLPRLRVMARSTVFRYKGQPADPRRVGRDLEVQAVLTGHVEHRGDAYVVGAELVDVEDGSQLWGTRLNRRAADVFALQAEMSQELTDALRLRLTRDERERIGKRTPSAPRPISCICAAAIS